jgi:RND family efflux transporter MFP subunit
VHFVPGGTSSQNVTRAAADFSRTQGGNAILSLPLRREAEIIAVLVLEFLPNARLAPQAMGSLTVAADILAPQLYDRYQNDRWLITKTGLSIKALAEKAIGPQYMLAKTISTAVAIGLFIVCVFKVTYHVAAPFQFSPVAKTTLSCPVDGYIQTVYVRPGSVVHKGDKLLQLRTVDLEKKLHQAEADAKRARADAMKDQSDAREDPTKMGDYEVHYAQELSAEAEAQLDQLEIDESTIRAPADGLVLTGDLEDKVNSFMKQGDELFTFQATDRLRAELSVAENDIQDVIRYGVHHGGMLATTSLPREKYPFTIERVDPMGEPKDGANIFKVYATLPESADHPEWRPGMEGEARINIKPRHIVWIWTHKFVDWLRLKTWTWL